MSDVIGIIGAMDSEVSAIYEKMTSKQIIQINDIKFYKGKLFEKDVVVIKCGIGKVNAALCTQLLIVNFKVTKIINTGIAGATGKNLNIYDFVVSTNLVYHDFDTQFFGYKLGQVPGFPPTFSANSQMVEKIISVFEKSELAKNHKIQKGLIASGDQFISGGEKKNFIVQKFNPLCVEMEGCAIAQTCYLHKIPFAVIRCMSDCADETVKTSYEEEKASAISSEFLLEVVKEI